MPSSDSIDVILGQSTLALELHEQTESEEGPLDAVVVSCSGGGMLAGVALAMRAVNPTCKVCSTDNAKVVYHQKCWDNR